MERLSAQLRTLGNSDHFNLTRSALARGPSAATGISAGARRTMTNPSRRDPPGAGPGRELDRYGSGLRAGPLRGSSGAGARGYEPQALRLHQVLDALERGSVDLPLAEGEIAGGGAACLAAPVEARIPSISIRSTGRKSRRSRSRKAGRRWQSSRSRARCAGSAYRTLMWRR